MLALANDALEERPVVTPAPRSLWFAAAIACTVLGAICAWGARHQMNSDGIAYLDMSDAALHGFRSEAYNPYWSPALPVLIAAVRLVIGRGPETDYAAAHIAVFLLYLAALAGISFLLRSIIAAERSAGTSIDTSAEPRDGTGTFVLLGFTLFAWTSIGLVTLDMITPDFGVAAAVFFASGCAVRLVRGSGTGAALGLGVSLGLGYLVKAVLFPVGLLLLGLVLVVMRTRRSAGRVAIAAALFGAIAAPQIAAVSRAEGRVTFSSVGNLVYGWYVDRLPCPLWSTGIECLGLRNGATLSTVNPPQPFPKMHTDPSVFVFTSDPRGTYPAWYDPTHWYPKFRPTIAPARQLRQLATNFVLDWEDLLPFTVALTAFILVSAPQARGALTKGVVRELGPDAMLVGVACVALLMYALVYTEPRYSAPFFVLLLLGSSTRTQGLASWRWHRMLLGAALVAGIGAVAPALRATWWARTGPNPALEVARSLHQLGVPAGTPLGVIGNGYVASFWARPARVRIIAQIHQSEADRFWSAPAAEQASVLEAFRRAGARAIVASEVPAWAPTEGWSVVNGPERLLVRRF